jgi:aryl-alcohol dehydrogenase-like predicted oxidoreductase
MDKRTLGRSSLSVAPLALGGNVFGWTADRAMSFRILDAFVDRGFNMIDTANSYSRWVPGNTGGESETIIGEWLKSSGKRNQVLIATKVGMEMQGEQGLKKDYILRACEASLARLGIDCIDLYFSHTDDASTPLEETLEAHTQLVTEGKVRIIGASNYSAERLAEALSISRASNYVRYEVLQPLYNLYDRAPYEASLMNLCVDESVSVTPYYGLAAGFLTGKYRSEKDLEGRARAGRIKSSYLNDRGLRILSAIDGVAAALGATPAQVALAWVMKRPGIAATISSATSVAQLDELMQAVTLNLDAGMMTTLDSASVSS